MQQLGKVMFALLLCWLGSQPLAKGQKDGDLTRYIFNALNELRASKDLTPLERVASLDKAAQKQADWCSAHDTLMHDRRGKGPLNALSQRVMASKGREDGLQENLFWFRPTPGITKLEWGRQAVDHASSYAIYLDVMLADDIRYGGVAVKFNAKRKEIVVCQVFAVSNWSPPAGVRLHRHAFGIKPPRKETCKKIAQTPTMRVDLIDGWNYDMPEDDEPGRPKLYFGSHQFRYGAIKELLTRPRGKIAPDIVFRDQFPCDGPNQLHGSPYHDGYLRRPRGWLYFALHHAKWPKKFKYALASKTHRAPILQADSLQINTVVTQKGRFCTYGIPFRYSRAPLGPFGFEEKYDFAPDTMAFGDGNRWRRKQLTFNIPFQKGSALPDSMAMVPLLDSLRLPGAELLSVRIRGFASVEGTLEINQDLYNRRAASITQRIQARQIKPVRMSSTAAENWPDFRRDTRGRKWGWLGKLSNDQVRDTLTQNKALLVELESILAKHRYASVDIDLRFAVDNTMDNARLIDSLHHAVAAKNYLAAQAVQSEMWRRWEDSLFPADTILHTYFPRIPACLPMIHNQYCLQERLGIKRPDDSSDPIVNISKTYPGFHIRQVLAMSKDAVHPLLCLPFPIWILKKITALKKLNVSPDKIRVMELNYYLGLCWWQALRYAPDKKLLAEVKKRYAYDTLDLQKVVPLAAYFNYCRATDESVKLMRPFMKPGLYNEDLLFLFAWTAASTPELVPEEEWLDWMVKAQATNPIRWKKMADIDWQVLRWPRLKALYCDCEAASKDADGEHDDGENEGGKNGGGEHEGGE